MEQPSLKAKRTGAINPFKCVTPVIAWVTNFRIPYASRIFVSRCDMSFFEVLGIPVASHATICIRSSLPTVALKDQTPIE